MENQANLKFCSGKKPTRAKAKRMAERTSEEGRRVDALALRAEERRDKLRKAAGRSKYLMIRRFLNGATHRERYPVPYTESIGMRGEPPELKHLSRERKRKQP